MPVIKDNVTNSDGEVVAIYVEVEDPQKTHQYYDDLRGQGNQVVEAASDVFSRGMSLIRTCAEQTVTAMQKIDRTMRPSEFEVQFAVKLDSEIGAILAKASAEAQLQVTMKWVKKDEA